MKQIDVRDDWDKHWEEFNATVVFNPAQAYRRRLIVSQLKKVYKPGMKILDIGSGQGDLFAELVALFPAAKIYGVDLSQKGVEISSRKVPSANFFKLNLLTLEEKIPAALVGEIDIAICSEVLEHLDEPLLFLENTAKLLKKDAVLVVTIPSGPRTAYDRYLGHRRHFGVPDIRKLLESAGYQANEIFRTGFPFFNLYKLLVMLRGKQIITDNKTPSPVVRLAMFCFSWLLKANFRMSPWGWQLIAVARA